MREKSHSFDSSKDIPKFEICGRDQDGRYQASCYGNWEFQFRDDILRIALSGKPEAQFFNARKKIDKVTIRVVFTSKTFFIETLIEEMKTVIISDKWGWVSMSRKIIDKRFFSRKFGMSWLWCNEQNQRLFTSLLLYKCYVWDWVFVGGIWTCSGWRIQVWKLSEIKKSSTTWKFRPLKKPMPGRQTGISHFQKTFTAEKFPVPTIIEEVTPVVFWWNMSLNVENNQKQKAFFWNCWIIRVLMQRRNLLNF